MIEADLVDRYGTPELARLWGRARDLVERRDLALTGTVSLPAASDAERAAIEQLLGRVIAGRGTLRIPLADLDRALRDTRYGAGLTQVLEAVGGTSLVARGGEAAARRQARRDRFASARANPLAASPAIATWLDILEGGALARAARGRDDEVLAECLSTLARLPASPPILRTVLASEIGRSPHALDDGAPVSTLVLRALALQEDVDPPRTSAERRALWRTAGVLADTVSADVLVLGLRLEGDDPASRLASAGATMGEPIRLTLRSLRDLDLAELTDRRVYVCENPSILELAAERLGQAAPPLVCLDGEPTTAAVRLLTALRAAGVELRYHGDFDPKGVEIASALMRLGARPWRFGLRDYLAAVARGLATDELAAGKVSASWDSGLRDAMAAVGAAVYEEQVAEDLIADLADERRRRVVVATTPRGDDVSPSRTRSHLLGDPILDWLNLHGRAHGYLPDDELGGYDPRTDLLPRILEQGKRFEAGIVALLERDVGIVTIATDRAAARNEDAVRRTVEAMRVGAPVIAQAVLRDERLGTAGIADLLVRSDVLEHLVPGTLGADVAALSAPAFGSPWHYRVVEVKYRTFDLTADGGASTSRATLPYLGQTWLYNRALGNLQGWTPPAAFLLGRGTTLRGDRISDALGRLGRVDDERDVPTRGQTLEEAVIESLDWVRRVRRDGGGWNVLPEPSVPELWPHLRNTADAPWHGAKVEIGAALGELTALPRMNPTRRAIAHAQGLASWRDPLLDAGRVGLHGTEARLFEAVRVANIAESAVVLPAWIERADPSWRAAAPIEFYVDFETVSDIEDDLGELPTKGGAAMVYQVGCGHLDASGTWRFAQWTADRLEPTEERSVLDAWLEHMSAVAQTAGRSLTDTRVYHWSPAEPSWLGDDDVERDPLIAARSRHPGAAWPPVPWFDLLLGLARAEPISVTGAFGFGLKPIAKAMHAAGLIATSWADGPADGLGAMVGAWWCDAEARRLGVRMGEVPLMAEIAAYNEVDCRVMAEVLGWLRANR